MADDRFNIHNVLVQTVPFFAPNNKNYLVTRVTIYIGDNGPFTKDFGPGQDQPATADAINIWKQQQVLFVQQTTGA
jgi:hypothetical protein